MSIWSQARELANNTPDSRNRYVDFLRAVSILFVIVGHWLITTAVFDKTTHTFTPQLALDIIPWTEWLTWVFQVMPIFFIVGGYSNAISLDSARKKRATYSEWLTGRLHRLLTPLLVLIVAWGVLSLALGAFGFEPETVSYLSKTALVPTWFLAIYMMIVLLAPLTYDFWRRWGYRSFLVYVFMAIAVDWAFFALGWRWLGWSNYFWVWLAVHHLGFAWYDQRLARPTLLIAVSILALLALLYLILQGPYPIAMAGSPGEAISNTLPPKVTLIALGLVQFGILLAFAKPMQALLRGQRLWAFTILVNSMIMTLYLWHMTVLIAVLALGYYSDGVGMHMAVNSPAWWWSRPLWLLVLTLLLIPLAIALSPLERITQPESADKPLRRQLILGAILCGLGITITTLNGFTGELFTLTGSGALLLIIFGGWICGLSPAVYRNPSN